MRKYFRFSHYHNVALFGIILLFGRAYEHGLTSDDLHYAAISRSLLSSGNPLLLTLDGVPYLNKPPLFFWLNSLMIGLFGNNTYGAKFITVAAAILLMLLIFHITLKTFDDVNAGYGAVIFFIANYIVFKHSQACRLESLLTLFIILSLVFACKYMERQRTVYLILSGFISGLAVMTKGAAGGFAFAVIVLYVLIFADRSDLKKLIMDIFASVAVFLVTFGWWYGYAFARTDLFKVQIINESVNRITFVDKGWSRRDPIFEFVKSFVMYNIIMIPFIVMGVYKKIWRMKNMQSVRLFLFYFAAYFVMIHFMKTKYDRYLYPLMPIVSIAAGVGLSGVVKYEMKRVMTAIYIIFACVMAVYPLSTGVPGYNQLTEIEEMARINNLKICVDKEYYDHWERKSSLVYYLNGGYQVGECGSGSIYITTRNGRCEGSVIVKNKRMTACLNQ